MHKVARIVCPKCGSIMQRKSRVKHLTLSWLLFFVGVFCILFVSWVVGLILIVVSMFLGAKKEKTYQCNKCSYFFHRK